MVDLIDEMANSILYWTKAAYRANEPEIAQDESPAAAMRAAIKRLRRRWLSRFNVASKELADYFAMSVLERSDASLKSILKRGGFAVEFKMTAAQNDVVQATIGQQVALIRSIPAQYLTNVEALVMRSIQTGRDLGQLTKDLQEQHSVTKRRAALIARTQNGMATASMTRARQIELGITEAIWQHSAGGKEPRPEHLKASGTKYDISKGLPIGDGGKYVLPGEEINCRCVARSVIQGFN